MAKKKVSNKIDFEVNDDLNFDEFDFGDNDSKFNNEVISKKRNPVHDVFKGTMTGIKDTVTNPTFVAETVKKSLPENYDTIFQTGDAVSKTLASLYDDANKEIKPKLKELSVKVDRLVPEQMKIMKKITSKFKEKLGGDNEYKAMSEEQAREQSIANSIGAIFNREAEQNNKLRARDEVRDDIKQNIEKKRFQSNFGLLSSINEQITRNTTYTEQVTNAYHKKSLELQYRSYFTQAQLLDTIKKFYDLFHRQNEAIVKNTALPEFVKMKSSEAFKEMARNKFFSGIQSSLFGDESLITKGLKNLKGKVKTGITDFKSSLESGLMGVDTLEQMKETNEMLVEAGMDPITPGSMIGSMAGGSLAKWLRNKTIDKGSKYVPDSIKKKVGAFGDKANIGLSNVGALADKFQNTDFIQNNQFGSGFKSYIARALFEGLDSFKETKPDTLLKNRPGVGSLNMIDSTFNNKTQLSITEIIPGYLARIYRELRITRTGNENIELTHYNYDKSSFNSETEIKEHIKQKLRTSVEKSFTGVNLVDTVEKLLSGSGDIQEEKKRELHSFLFSVLSVPNLEFSPEAISKTKAFNSLSKDTQELLIKLFEDKFNNSETSLKNRASFAIDMRRLKDSSVDLRGQIQDFDNAGYRKQLQSLGLINDNKSGIEIDLDKHQNFVSDVINEKLNLSSQDRIVTELRNLEDNKPSTIDAFVKTVIKAGKGSILKTLGIINDVKNPEINYKRVNELKVSGSSDVSLKRNIKSFNPSEALESIKKTAIYKYLFKDGKGPKGEMVGGMAGDMQRNMGDDVAPDGKIVNLMSANGLNQAAIQKLAENQDDINKKLENSKTNSIRKLIEMIKEDTGELVKQNKIAMNLSFGVDGMSESALKAMIKSKNFVKDKANEFSDKKDSYTQIAKDLTSNVTSLLFKGIKDSAKTLGKIFTTAKDDFIKPLVKSGKETYDNNKDSVKEGFKNITSSLFKNAVDLTNKAIDIGKDVIFNRLPAGMDILAKIAVKAKNKLLELDNPICDIYIKGKTDPVLKAQLMRTGYYFDQSNGKVINGIKDLLKIKGNIVNPEGNVVLTREEMQDGLYDNKGQKIEIPSIKLLKFGLALGIAAFSKVKDKLKDIKDLASEKLPKISDYLKDKKDKLLGKLDSVKIPSGFGINIGSDKVYNVLVEIRDLIKMNTFDKLPSGEIKPSKKMGFRKAITLEKTDTKQEEKKPAFNDQDKDGSRDGGWKDRIKQFAERVKNRKSNKSEADLTAKYKGDNIIDVIMGKASAAIGGITDLLGKAGDFLSLGKGGIISGIGEAITGVIGGALKLLPGLGKVASFGGAVMRTATVATTVGAPVLSGLGSLAMSAGTAVLGGLATILSSPVTLGALAVVAIGVGGYLAYKHFTKNNSDPYQDIRLKQYGLTNTEGDKRFNSQIFELENYLNNECIGLDSRKGAYLLEKKLDSSKVLGMFDIDGNDKSGIENFTKWFQQRFKPFFLTHVTAIKAINKAYGINDVSNLSNEEKLKYLKLISFESGPYNISASPFKDLPELNKDKTPALNAISKQIDEINKAISEDKSKPKEDKLKPKVATTSPAAGDQKPSLPKLDTPVNTDKRKSNEVPNINEGEEGKVNESAINSMKATAKSIGSLPMAAGALRDGSGAGPYLKINKNVDVSGVNQTLFNQFKGMVQEYGELTGKSVIITSGSRSSTQQQALYNKNPKLAAPPGRSLHEFGLALDANSADLEEMDKLGLMKKYGFTRPVGGEPWHVEPSGIQANIPGAKANASLADRLIQASLGRGGGGAAVDSSVPKGSRDIDLAVSLFNAGSKEINTKVDGNIIPTTFDRSKQISTTVSGLDKRNSSYDDSFVSSDKNEDMKKTIYEASKEAGVDPATMALFAAKESSMNPNARARTSSASGLLQFIDGTWNESIAKHGSKYNLDPNVSKTDPRASVLMGAEYIKQNMKNIQAYKPDANITDLYLSHFLGPAGAKRFITARPDEIGASILGTQAEKNKEIFFENGRALTVAEIRAKIERQLNKTAKDYGIKINTGGDSKTKSLNTTAANFNTASSIVGISKPTVLKPSVDTENISLIPKQISNIVDRRPPPPISAPASINTFNYTEPINSISSDIKRSVNVQEEMLKALQMLSANLTPEALAAVLKSIPTSTEQSVPNNTNNRKPGFLPESSLDLRRKMT